MNNQLFRFFLVSIGNTVSFMIVIVFLKFFGIGDVISNFLAYTVAITQSFVLNRNWTFLHEGKLSGAALKYVIVIIFAYLINLSVLLYALDILKINSYLSHGLGAIAYGAVTFIAMRYIVFSNKEKKELIYK